MQDLAALGWLMYGFHPENQVWVGCWSTGRDYLGHGPCIRGLPTSLHVEDSGVGDHSMLYLCQVLGESLV